jgi:hypothetical protein
VVFRCLDFFTDSSKCLVFSQILGGLCFFPHIAKFSRILHEHKILSEHSRFILHLALVSLLLWLEHRLKHCQIFTKKNTSEKIFYFHEVSKKSPRSIQIELDSSRCLGFFTDTVWIVGPLGQAIRFYFDQCATKMQCLASSLSTSMIEWVEGNPWRTNHYIVCTVTT